MWPFTSSCDHEWGADYETEYKVRGDLDAETGEMEWIAHTETGDRCVHCGETRNVEKTKRRFVYTPDEVIEE
jgi:hypothetical protein